MPDDRILDQLKRAFKGDAWHGPSVLEVLDGGRSWARTLAPRPSRTGRRSPIRVRPARLSRARVSLGAPGPRRRTGVRGREKDSAADRQSRRPRSLAPRGLRESLLFEAYLAITALITSVLPPESPLMK